MYYPRLCGCRPTAPRRNVESVRIECELVQHGFNDIVEYPTIRHYTESLPLLYKKENLVLY